MQHVPYRNIHGYLFSPSDIIVTGRRTRGNEQIAHYIRCPQSGTLKYIYKCEECERFAGFLTRGLKCRCKKRPPSDPIYDRERP